MIKKGNDESGMIMVVVITFVVVIGLLMVGMFSRSESTGLTTAANAHSMQADALARGAYALVYGALVSGQPMPSDWTETIDGRVYSITLTNTASPITGTRSIGVRVSY